MNFGEKLFNLRKEKGLSQEALAEQLNTTRQAISKWENNHGYPETEKLLKLSDIFQVSFKRNHWNRKSKQRQYLCHKRDGGQLSFQRKHG